ncbi:MAG: methionine synthase, partial [Actinomycetota bacterium]|nr:methionine synthase [Actinomycetota bacterium]
ADPGARRDLEQSLAEGISRHVRDVKRRLSRAELVVQVDEPALPAVLAGEVPTASGLHRHRAVGGSVAGEVLGWVVDAVVSAGAAPVAHCCAARVPVAVLTEAGFRALSVDLALISGEQYDEYSRAVDAGVGLWLGAVPATQPPVSPTDRDLTARVQRLLDDLGVDAPRPAAGAVVTPACGLAGADPAWARTALRLARRIARNLAGEVSDPGARMSS